MARKSRKAEMDEVEMDLTPMIDIVFNLLIFFMLSTKFIVPEGMIEAFQTISAKGASVTPSDLADGISKALVTTFLGLLVAIPTLIAYFFFRNKVVRVTLEIGAIADDLVERFRGK